MDHISLYWYIREVTHAAVSGVGDPTERHALVTGFEQPRGHKALFGSSTRAVTRGRSLPSILIHPRSPPLGFAGSEPVLQPIMPLDLPVKVRSWELTVYPR